MFRILRSLDVHQMQLPEICSMKEGCDPFSRFFQDKIDKLLTKLHCHTAVDPAADETPCFTDSIQVFEPTTMAEITTALGTTDKTCKLNPLPSKQLNDNMKVSCLSSPILQTPHSRMQLCVLCQLSKVIEKVIVQRIISHISDQRMEDCFKSAYQKNHSTETAVLLCVPNALKATMYNRQGTALVLIDFSVAFDTINHEIMSRYLPTVTNVCCCHCHYYLTIAIHFYIALLLTTSLDFRKCTIWLLD